MAAPKLTRKELERLLTRRIPANVQPARADYAIDEVWYGGCRSRQHVTTRIAASGRNDFRDDHDGAGRFRALRRGPVGIGWVPLAVTTNLSINFLKRPAPRDLLAEARLIKLGKRLAVGDIGIRSEGEDDLVAHATSTYSIPPSTVI